MEEARVYMKCTPTFLIRVGKKAAKYRGQIARLTITLSSSKEDTVAEASPLGTGSSLVEFAGGEGARPIKLLSPGHESSTVSSHLEVLKEKTDTKEFD